MAMPSETEMVPNSSGYPPAACTPFLTAFANRSSDRLQGVISFHEDATPIWGLTQSSSPMPTARSIPRAAVFSRPSVTSRERGFMSGASGMRRAYFRPDPRFVSGSAGPHRGLPSDESLQGGGADHHHVRKVGDDLSPSVPGVGRGPHGAVAGADVEAGTLVVVGGHRVTHHADIE